ncbi:MAG: PorP/SprF family type IX secretion system membrane protein [Paludibacteraceae bacterium]|nr:PorP/SprF family type IX secretion system membrane protein [Paludibacteraceae bacterium]
MKKMFRYIIATLMASFVFTTMQAAEDIVVNQYHFNYYLVNPAVAGAERCHNLMLTGRFDFAGVEGHPMTQTLSYRTRILKNVGVGVYAYNDKNGSSYRQGGEVTFAYHIPLSENNHYMMKSQSIDRQLSFGLSLMLNHYNFDKKLFDKYASEDGVFGNGGTNKGMYLNANAGVYFLWDNFFAGFSAKDIIPSEMIELGLDEPKRPLSFFGFAGYDFDLVNNITIEPAVMFKADNQKNRQLDINLKFMQTLPDNKDFSYWLQGSYRHTLDKNEHNPSPLCLFILGGARYKGFHLGYGYRLGLTDFQRKNGGGHEVMLGYTWCVTKHFCR